MLNTRNLVIAALAGMLALPATAGPWPNLPSSKGRLGKPFVATADAPESLERYRVFPSEEYRGRKAFARDAAPPASATSPTRDGFEYVGGDTGWQLAQHKYVRAGGRFMHSEECDHAMRAARAPTADEVEAGRKQSPG